MDNIKDRITIYEVAKACGVSLATVSRVINHQNNVKEETRKKVEEAIARLAYKPSALAKGLATNRTTNIGIILPAANYVYISNMLNGMVDIGKIYGYQTTLFFAKHSKEDVNDAIDHLITSMVDGAIIFDDELEDKDFTRISSYKIPFVAIGNRIEDENAACITLDYHESIEEILNCVAEKPDKPLYVIHVEQGGKLIHSVEESIYEYYAKHEVLDQNWLINCEDSYTQTYNQFLEYFKTNKKGFFIAPRDSLAAALMNAAIDNGLRVPEDVEILSIIGTKYANITRPSLSSLNIDMFEVGSIAMRMVTKLLKGDLENKIFSFKSNLISRNSTMLKKDN